MTHDALFRAIQDTVSRSSRGWTEKGVEILDVTGELNGRREFFIDGVHLSEKGSEEIARRVADFIGLRRKG